METRNYLFETLFKQFLAEQKDVNINQFDDLIGKSITFKIDSTYKATKQPIELMVKGIINTMKVNKYNDGVSILLKDDDKPIIIGTSDYFLDQSNKYAPGGLKDIRFECANPNIFMLPIMTAHNGYVREYVPATCKALSKILSQRYPCKTDLAMTTPMTIPNELT
jgi:hypothetical protein